MSNKLIVIGANEYQYPLVKKANDMGFETHVFAWEDGAVAKDIATKFYPISITEKDEILKLSSNLGSKGVCTIGTDLAIPTVNFLANKLGLIGNSDESAIKSTNKYYMRKAFLENNIPIPWFKEVQGFSEVDLKEISLPVIVKPTDRSGSRGIFKVEKMYELKKAINSAIEFSFEKRALIEEYVDGDEYSIEMISQNGSHYFLQITKKFTTGSPNFIEIGHLAPAKIDKELENKIVDTVKNALDSLDVKNGASHSELKINVKGEIKIIEIGARMGGDYIGSHMVKISSGIDFVEKVIQVATGESIYPLSVGQGNYALVKFIFDEKDLDLYKTVKEKYPRYIIEEDIKEKFNENVIDSSSRNGHYIMSIDSKENLADILKILNLGEAND